VLPSTVGGTSDLIARLLESRLADAARLCERGFRRQFACACDSLAAGSRDVSRVAYLSPTATPMEWLMLLVQAYVGGPHHSQALVAQGGVPLASFAWERFVATAPVKGQTSAMRFVRSPATRANSETLARGLRINGFFNVQFVIEEATGIPYLLEINRRVVTHMHPGERVGRDLPRALMRALEGMPLEAPTAIAEDAGGKVVVFPREWLRDRHSRHLVELPVDVPWDDPALFAAMLALRRDD
jgi:hypothetical protein